MFTWKLSVTPSFAFLSHHPRSAQTPTVYQKRQNSWSFELHTKILTGTRSHSLDSCWKGSSRSSLQAWGETMTVLKEHHCPPWDGTDPGCTAASLPLTPRAAGQPARPAQTQLCYNQHNAALAQEPHDHNFKKGPWASIWPCFLQFHSKGFFFLAVGCCKIHPSFHHLHTEIEFIPCANHRAPSPQNPSVTAIFHDKIIHPPYTHTIRPVQPQGRKLLLSHHQGNSYDPWESLQGFSYERSKFRAGMQTSFTDPENMLSAPVGPFCRHPAQRGDSRESSAPETLWSANTSLNDCFSHSTEN